MGNIVCGKVYRRMIMLQWLNGKKTYLVCIGAVITALIAYIEGNIEMSGLVTAIFGAIGAMSMRAGITKSGNHK